MHASAGIRELRWEIERVEPRPRRRELVVPTGIPSLDALLPDGGLPRGQVVEWGGPRSCGKTTLLRSVLERLREAGEPVAIIDGTRTLYAPDWTGLVRGGGRFWVVRPPSPGEAAWCADLLLRSGAFGVVALDFGCGATVPGSAACRSADGLRRGVAVRLQRLAEEAGALFVAVCEVPVAALRLRFRPGRVEPVRGSPFGPFLPLLRPVWIRVDMRGSAEVPVLCAAPLRRGAGKPTRDRKGPE